MPRRRNTPAERLKFTAFLLKLDQAEVRKGLRTFVSRQGVRHQPTPKPNTKGIR